MSAELSVGKVHMQNNQSALDKGQRARCVQGKVVKKQFVPVSAETFRVDFSGMNDRRSRLFSRVVSSEFDSPLGRNQDKDVTVDGS